MEAGRKAAEARRKTEPTFCVRRLADTCVMPKLLSRSGASVAPRPRAEAVAWSPDVPWPPRPGRAAQVAEQVRLVQRHQGGGR
jgi:hypothetical protein